MLLCLRTLQNKHFLVRRHAFHPPLCSKGVLNGCLYYIRIKISEKESFSFRNQCNFEIGIAIGIEKKKKSIYANFDLKDYFNQVLYNILYTDLGVIFGNQY